MNRQLNSTDFKLSIKINCKFPTHLSKCPLPKGNTWISLIQLIFLITILRHKEKEPLTKILNMVNKNILKKTKTNKDTLLFSLNYRLIEKIVSQAL